MNETTKQQIGDAGRQLCSSALLGAILDRAEAVMNSCNSFHINHQGGVMRGLVWAYTGNDPGSINDTDELGRIIGKKIKVDGGKLSFDEPEAPNAQAMASLPETPTNSENESE